MALGLNRMIRNAASYMSLERRAGAAATAPGLCAAPSIPGRRRPARAGPGGGPPRRAAGRGGGPRERRRCGGGGGYPAGRGAGPPGRRVRLVVRQLLSLRRVRSSASSRLVSPYPVRRPAPPRSRGTGARTDLALSGISAKIVRLLRRVAGVRHTLTTESRLLNGIGGLACVRTEPGDPISPTNPSGAINNDAGPRSRVAPNQGDTPDRGGRPRGRAAGGGAGRQGLTRGPSRNHGTRFRLTPVQTD